MEMTCQKCQSALEFTDEMQGQLADCGQCGNVVEVPFKKPPVESTTAVATPSPELETAPVKLIPSAREYLFAVRSQTSYQPLRGALFFFQVTVSFMVGFVVFGFSLAGALETTGPLPTIDKLGAHHFGMLTFSLLISGVCARLAWSLSRAITGVFVAIVDIAGLLADQGRKR